MLPKTPLERRAVRSCFELMSATLRFMERQLSQAVYEMPRNSAARTQAEAERATMNALSLIYDALMDAHVRR